MHCAYNSQKLRLAARGYTQTNLHTAFSEAVELYESWNTESEPEPTVEVGYDDTVMRLSELCGALWNCTDIMPNRLCRSIDDLLPKAPWNVAYCREGASYASGARKLKGLIIETLAERAAGLR